MRKIVVLIFLVLLFTYNSRAENKYGGTLVFGKAADAVTMDPAHATDGETFNATVQIYDRLVHFKYGSTDIEPGLAESWKISKDGLEYVFYLRKGVTFHKTPYFKRDIGNYQDLRYLLSSPLKPNHVHHNKFSPDK